MRRRGGRKWAWGTRAPITGPQGPNQHWSLDFVSDVLADGRRFRMLVVDTSLSGRCVVRALDRIIQWRCAPLLMVSDNGTELTSHAVLAWQ